MTTITFDEADASAVTSIIKSLGNKLSKLSVEKLVAQIDDLNAAIAAEGADVTAILAVVAADVASLQDLQNQLAAALANAAPDLTASIAAIQAQTASLAASLPPPAPPADSSAA